MTSKDTHNATSSQELRGGSSHCNSQDGQQMPLFGQDHAHANRLAVQVDTKAKKTIDTYGQHGTASSASADLQSSLESKLQQRLPKGGLTMFMKCWKRKATPLGRLYFQLQQSVRPIKGSDCGLWPTATASDWKRRGPNSRQQGLGEVVRAAAAHQWNPAMWATPNTMDSLPPRSKEAMERQFATTRKGRTAPANLREQVVPAMYPTPSSRDWKDTIGMTAQRKDGKSRIDQLPRVIGMMHNGSSAQTEKPGQLNPAFPCWLMGFSTASLYSMQSAMQSYRK